MPNQKTTLKRLAVLYGVVLKAELLEMHRQWSLLDEAEQAIIRQEGSVWKAHEIGRVALKQSDLLGWKQARVEAAIAAWNNDKLNAIRDERRGLYESAGDRYRANRILGEQLDKLLENADRRSAEIEERRAQTMTDERYLSRRRWMEVYGRAANEDVLSIDK